MFIVEVFYFDQHQQASTSAYFPLLALRTRQVNICYSTLALQKLQQYFSIFYKLEIEDKYFVTMHFGFVVPSSKM